MIITQEFVDTVAPEHGRTSCSDTDLSNSYGGWEGKYDHNTGKREIHYPRCNRCYLLRNLGEDTKDLEFLPVVDINLTYQHQE